MNAHTIAEALKFYESMAKQMGDAVLAMDNQRVMFLMKEIAVDHGRRAREALLEIAQS